jgi:hypothetical protein
MNQENEIDYRAREEFLYATTRVMDPPPIDLLLAQLPLCLIWLQQRRAAYPVLPPDLAAITRMGEVGDCSMGRIGDSPEARALKDAVQTWMQRCSFLDEWLADAALCTLYEHANGRAKSRTWRFAVDDLDQTHPLLTLALRKNQDETLEEFCSRADREYGNQRKEFKKMWQFRMGLRKQHLLPSRWTAMLFKGLTLTQVAQQENQDPDVVRKAVSAFKKRATLRYERSQKRSGDLCDGKGVS